MKLFIGLIIAAAVISGFVGAEITGDDFSITGAVIGGVGVFGALMGLGAFFDSQEKKRRAREVSPEMRGVFDRMFGVDTLHSGKTFSEVMRDKKLSRLITSDGKQFTSLQQIYIKQAVKFTFLLLASCSLTPTEALKKLKTNARARGYLNGVHTALLRRMGLVINGKINSNNTIPSNMDVIEICYKEVFGEIDFSNIVWLGERTITADKIGEFFLNLEEYMEGTKIGEKELDHCLNTGSPALGFKRILVLGQKE
jgi:hypothetical protein